MAAQGPRTKMPTTSETYDRGVAAERARILKILRAHLAATDEVCEASQWRVLEEVIRRIDPARPLIEVFADEID